METNMSVWEKERAAFGQNVAKAFRFLETDRGMSLAGVDYVDDGPRDSYVVAKYRRGEHRVDVVWAPVEMGLGILVRVETSGLSRHERSIYLEPAIAFLTNGRTAPIVPQIYLGMSIRRIEKAMRLRRRLFADGYTGVLEVLADRLDAYHSAICDMSCETVKEYHAWYSCKAGR